MGGFEGLASLMRNKKKKFPAKRKTPPDPVILLHVLARMLTECEQAGIHPKLKHGIVYTDVGYVLDVRDGKWAARPLKPR